MVGVGGVGGVLMSLVFRNKTGDVEILGTLLTRLAWKCGGKLG